MCMRVSVCGCPCWCQGLWSFCHANNYFVCRISLLGSLVHTHSTHAYTHTCTHTHTHTHKLTLTHTRLKKNVSLLGTYQKNFWQTENREQRTENNEHSTAHWIDRAGCKRWGGDSDSTKASQTKLSTQVLEMWVPPTKSITKIERL